MKIIDRAGVSHGATGYNYGCRCDTCVTWKREVSKRRNERLRQAKRDLPAL